MYLEHLHEQKARMGVHRETTIYFEGSYQNLSLSLLDKDQLLEMNCRPAMKGYFTLLIAEIAD
tara:strand:+ start:140 stop:328 length:189 start_codon:yes stop_codon:yes gene_type:complete